MKILLLFLLVFIFPYHGLQNRQVFPVRQITSGPEQKGFPSWSPDSKFLVHQVSSWNDTLGKNGLWIIDQTGRVIRRIYSGISEHPKWSPDGRSIVFDADTGNSIRIISADGGMPEKFLPDTVLIGNGGLPCWSPDGTEIAFVEKKGLSLCTYSFRTGNLKKILSVDGKVPLPGGWWNDGGSILIALMDMKTRKSTIQRVFVENGRTMEIPCDNENFYRHLALSPDGSLLVFAAVEGKYLGLRIMSSSGGTSIPLAVSGNGHNEGATWSPDGSKIAFNSTRSGNFDIWVMDIDTEKVKSELKISKKE